MTQASLKLDSDVLYEQPGYVVVIEAGDGVLDVVRSWVVRHDDPVYVPVLEMVERLGLSLVETSGPLDDGYMIGLSYQETYR